MLPVVPFPDKPAIQRFSVQLINTDYSLNKFINQDALHKLLTEGSGPGVKVTKRDGKGPVKLRYSGQDERGKDVMVWLQRTRWDLETATPD